MDILALAPKGGNGSPGLDAVARTTHSGGVTMFSSVSTLLSCLKQRLPVPAILILFVDSPDQLRSLETAGNLLSGLSIVVALAGMDRESVALAHRLQPRVVIAQDEAGDELAAIVGKMLGIHPALQGGNNLLGKGGH